MGPRTMRGEPRAHGVLLGLALAVLLAGLSLARYVTHAGGETVEQWRGHAFRAADTLTALMLIAFVLAGLRLLTQLVAARAHRRRLRRNHRPPRHLGGVSVIVPVYNEAADIAATVRSLVRNDYPGIEVIVVDDGSTDGTADIVERLGLLGVYVLRQPHTGRPAALNTGIAYAQHDILVLVDGDTVVAPDAIGRLVQPLGDPRVGAVSGNTKVADRSGLLGRWQHLEYAGFNLDRRVFDVAGCVPTVPGAIAAFRRAALQDTGGVSAQTLAGDIDVTMGVLRAGWRVVHEPAGVAWTEAPATLRRLWRRRYRWCYGAMQAMGKHRRALTRRGAAGRHGRRGLGFLLLFQVLLPLTAPMVDVYALYGLFVLDPATVALTWTGFTAVQIATAAHALKLDGERLGPLWSLPLQQIVHRQLMCLVVIRSTVTALLGGRLRRHRMVGTGAATAHAGAPPPAPVPVPAPPVPALPVPAPPVPVPPARRAGGADRYLSRIRPADEPTRTLPAIAARRPGRAHTGRATGRSHWPVN